MACDVVAHVQARDPQLANELWGDRRLLRKAFCRVLTEGICMICYSPADAYASDVMHLSSQFALYCNRLMDYWHNIEIVNKQLQEMKSRLQPGERIVRDSIWRFVYARIA